MTTGPGNYPPNVSDREWAQHDRDMDEDFREPEEPEYDPTEGE